MAVPEPVTLVDEIAVQLSNDCGVSVRLTALLKPFRAVIVIVDVADEVAGTEAGEVAKIMKS